MTELRCLTIRQPWAGLVALGVKSVENRAWSTNYRGRVAVHAGRVVDEDAWSHPLVSKAAAELGVVDLLSMTGVVLAVPSLDHICTETVDTSRRPPIGETWCGGTPWAVPGYRHWMFTDPQLLSEPVRARGRQGLWTPEPHLAEQILSRLP